MPVPFFERLARFNRFRFSLAAALLGLAAMPALAAEQLDLSDAWVRAVPPVSSGTAGYFVLRNDGSESVTIEGATAAFAHHVMLHSMARNEDGLREMKHMGAVTVAPGETVTFAPGGMHLMIMGMETAPAEGEQVEICLTLGGGETLCRNFEVRREQP